MTSKFASRRALNRQQIYAIGFVAAEWSNLEFAMMMALGELLGLTPAAAVALGGLSGSVSATTDALVRISRELDAWQPIAEKLEVMCKNINELAVERNNIVHGTWDMHLFKNPETSELVIRHHAIASGSGFPKRGKKTTRSFSFTAKEMLEIAVASHEAALELLHLVWRKPLPLPKTPTLALVLDRKARRWSSVFSAAQVIARVTF